MDNNQKQLASGSGSTLPPPTPEEISIAEEIKQLGAADLLPFQSVTKLPIKRIYTVTKVVRRTKGQDGAPFTGIQLHLDNELHTALPRKWY
ncbi:hypothetical protein U1Q18_050400 [Sarracenia purpurea var. burkii]